MIVALMFLMFFYTIGMAMTFCTIPDAKQGDPFHIGTGGLIISFIAHIIVLGMLLSTVYAAPNFDSPLLKTTVEQSR